MQRAIFGVFVGLIGVGLILSLPVRSRPAPPTARVLPALPTAPRATPFEAAVYEARVWRARAKATAKQEMELREVALPGEETTDEEAWRRALLDADPSRATQRALAASHRASDLARTPAEKGRAAALRVMVECEAGHHREELRQARRLARIEGSSRHALTVLLRAARCNGEDRLARATTEKLEAMPERAR